MASLTTMALVQPATVKGTRRQLPQRQQALRTAATDLCKN
ncbi:photosystem I reaction center subunit VI, chloroplastic-like [Iris pallida]|uniref:Photosystem I reaction center subunit VI, chloroplastic-like n=1 Tax=Iris pallida TaxID=29817 RepID=A0AAX6G8L7_IRIPA|nr:photosystem I reaction center subunit VI, chloroplastic-like [Iris pallida]